MTLPPFDLGYSDDDQDAATVTSLDTASTDPDRNLFAVPVADAAAAAAAAATQDTPSSATPAPRVRSLSDISREPTTLEKSARISSWLAGLAPPRDLSALRVRPSTPRAATFPVSLARHATFPGALTPAPRPASPVDAAAPGTSIKNINNTSYLLSDSGSSPDSVTQRNSDVTLPSEENTPATSIYDSAAALKRPSRARRLFVHRTLSAPLAPLAPLAPSARRRTTLTVLGPAFGPRMPRPGTPEFALLFFALMACAIASPRALFIFTFAYCWGRLSERAFCGAQREADAVADDEDEGVRLGRRMARIIG